MKSIDEDLTDGLAYGFPVCCVLMFLNRGGTANDRQALDHGLCNRDDPYVPCGFFHFPDYFPEAWQYEPYALTTEVWDFQRGRYV